MATCHSIKTPFPKTLRGAVVPGDPAEAPDAPEEVDGGKGFPLWNPNEWNRGDEWKYRPPMENDPLAPHYVQLEDLGLEQEYESDEGYEGDDTVPKCYSYQSGGRYISHGVRRVDDSDSDSNSDCPSMKEQTQLAPWEDGWDGYHTNDADGWDDGYAWDGSTCVDADGWDGEQYGADWDAEQNALDGESCI